MSKKPKSAPVPDDGMPSHEDLDAVMAQIEAIADEAAAKDADDAAADKAASKAQGGEDAPAEINQAGLDKIAELETELAALKDQALRAMAETDNVKKRAEREVAAARLYGIERFGADILSVADNLSRALTVIDDKARETLGENAKNLVDGIELTQKDLMAVFARHGIKAVPGKGSKFDPNVHQAVAQIPSAETKGDVAEVMQTGFTIGERTLRAAMVAVSAGPAKT